MKLFLFLTVILFIACNNGRSNKDINMGNEKSLYSEITCPKCGHKKMEKMPTDVCVITYTCEKCKADLHPKDGDCCVFCTYGTNKCPSKE
jgi:DNA-directed RNA polymerase subunit RPC12/RpoP